MMLRILICKLMLALCLVGCGPPPDVKFVQSSNDMNIKKMGNAYMLYASWSRYTGPNSREDLERFLASDTRIAKNLELMGIDRELVDQYFVSENDGQEFDFRWGVFINPDRQRSREPLVFEKEGKDGVRLVMLSNSKILEVTDDAKYQSLLKGKVAVEDAQTDLEKAEASSFQ